MFQPKKKKCFILFVLWMTLFFQFYLAGCQPIVSWDETEIVTPSGIETTTTESLITQKTETIITISETIEPSPTPVQTTSLPTTSITTTSAVSQPTSATTTFDLNRLDHTKNGWYYLPATQLGADQPATLPKSVLDLIKPYDVFWQDQNPSGKIIYLTMDEGYEYENLTGTILDVAKEYKVPIAFFVTGSYIRHNPEYIKRMASEGHQILNHTDSHPNLPDLLGSKGPDAVIGELSRVEEAFSSLTGQSMPKIMRPPEGSYSERMLALLSQSGYRVVFWSFAYRDWLTDEQPDPQQALQKILDNLHPGSVLLLHAVSKTNAMILDDFINAATARGYQFKPLPLSE